MSSPPAGSRSKGRRPRSTPPCLPPGSTPTPSGPRRPTVRGTAGARPGAHRDRDPGWGHRLPQPARQHMWWRSPTRPHRVRRSRGRTWLPTRPTPCASAPATVGGQSTPGCTADLPFHFGGHYAVRVTVEDNPYVSFAGGEGRWRCGWRSPAAPRRVRGTRARHLQPPPRTSGRRISRPHWPVAGHHRPRRVDSWSWCWPPPWSWLRPSDHRPSDRNSARRENCHPPRCGEPNAELAVGRLARNSSSGASWSQRSAVSLRRAMSSEGGPAQPDCRPGSGRCSSGRG